MWIDYLETHQRYPAGTAAADGPLQQCDDAVLHALRLRKCLEGADDD